MNFLLPFKLHGSRIRKHRRSDSCAMESEVEKNEQSIENEFLRLFDYARCKLSYYTFFEKLGLCLLLKLFKRHNLTHKFCT